MCDTSTHDKGNCLKCLSIVYTDIKTCYNSAGEEKEAIEKFIKMNPYPSYKKMLSILPMVEWSEYSEGNHEICKDMYEHLTELKRNKAIMLTIPEHRVRSALYYTLCNWSPLRYSSLTKYFAVKIYD